MPCELLEFSPHGILLYFSFSRISSAVIPDASSFFCLLSQICFVFDNSNLQHIRTFPMGFAFFLFCHHSTKCD